MSWAELAQLEMPCEAMKASSVAEFSGREDLREFSRARELVVNGQHIARPKDVWIGRAKHDGVVTGRELDRDRSVRLQRKTTQLGTHEHEPPRIEKVARIRPQLSGAERANLVVAEREGPLAHGVYESEHQRGQGGARLLEPVFAFCLTHAVELLLPLSEIVGVSGNPAPQERLEIQNRPTPAAATPGIANTHGAARLNLILKLGVGVLRPHARQARPRALQRTQYRVDGDHVLPCQIDDLQRPSERGELSRPAYGKESMRDELRWNHILLDRGVVARRYRVG